MPTSTPTTDAYGKVLTPYEAAGNTQAQNQGRPGYDTLGNPVAPAQAPTPTTSTTGSPTIASLYGSETPTDQGLDSSVGVYKDIANAPVDEAGIRSNVMSGLQAEIDATNQVYAEKLRQATIAGEGRLGSNAAISARRGLIGSDFGASANKKVVDDNNDVYSGINQEKDAAIGAITDKGNTLVQQEIAAKNAAKQAGAQDYINFLTQADARKTSRTTDAAQHALSAGVDLSTASPADINSIASSYNISPDALVSAYTAARKASATLTSVPITDSAYQLDPKTGQYVKVQAGAATPDSALKEYQYAVQNNGYTGSLADWNADKANQKVSVGGSRNPLTGALDIYDRTGPGVAGTGTSGSATGTTTPLPGAGSSNTPTTLPSNSGAPTPLGSSTGLGALGKTSLKGSPDQLQPLPAPTTKFGLQYEKNFTSGTTATQVNALNTAVGHLFDANTKFASINNGQYPNANALSQFLQTADGQAAATAYKQAAGLVGDEIAGAYGADTESARLTQAANGASIQSPAQHQAFVQTTAQLLSSKITAQVQAYRNAMGSNPTSLDLFISPTNQVKLATMGVDTTTLAPGLPPSPYAQALMQNAHTTSNGNIYIPVDPSNPQGAYQLLQ